MTKHDAYFIFDGEIASKNENIQKLLDIFNQEKGNILLGIDSVGGCNATNSFLLKMLNENKERVSVMVLNSVYSSAFVLFYDFKGKKYLSKGARGMYHYSHFEMSMNANGRPTLHEDIAVLKDRKRLFKEQIDFIKTFMTKTEQNKFRKGEDVYFDFARMQEIFPDAEII